MLFIPQSRYRCVVGGTHWDTVCVLLSDSFSFSLTLLEGMLVLELGTHINSMCGFP